MASQTAGDTESIGKKYNFRWHHFAIRTKDPTVSVPFYEKRFGMKMVHSYKIEDSNKTVYFLYLPRDDPEALPSPGTVESEKFLWDSKEVHLEIMHSHGSENDNNFKVNNGNVEPHRGFGHLAFNCDDVYATSKKLEDGGVSFHKRPDEGRMKGLAFALDTDGYWVELLSRSPNTSFKKEYNLSQCMLRVKDPVKSLEFYCRHLGMTNVRELHYDDFSLYFLATLPQGEVAPDPKDEKAREYLKSMWCPILELTHNHGTEKDASFSYHNGNDEPKGFGHVAFVCDDLDGACRDLEKAGVKVKPEIKKETSVMASAVDPDGYHVELFSKNPSFPQWLIK